MAYEGSSIVDYLRSVGQPTDYASRAQLAASKNIGGYVGSAQQNTQLLNILRGGGAVQSSPAPQPQVQQSQPSYAQPQAAQSYQPATSQSSGTGGFNEAYLKSKGYNDPNVIQNILNNPSSYSIYQDFQRESGAGPSGIDTAGLFKQPTIDLPKLYQGLYDTSGIKDIEAQLAAKSQAYTDAVSKIKDNPYLSEATMTGRLSKLQDKFNADTSNINSQIAMKKADIETKLNLETKQFDITSQQAQQAFNQFTGLLSAGALDNVSGEDIANITRATGLNSSMIQSMVAFQKKKNAPQPNITTVDDGINQYVVAIDPSTGNVINKQIIAPSVPKSTGGGGGGGGSSGTAGERAAASAKTALSDMSSLINGSLDASGNKSSVLQRGSDGYLSPQAYQYYRSLWVAQGLSTKDFESQFSYLKNPYQEGY
jgi:hypothetical protein